MDPELNSRLSGIELINLVDATNTLKLTAKDVLDLSDAVDLVAVNNKVDYHQLVVRGSTGATVDLADSATGTTGWTKGSTVTGINWGDTGNYTVWINNTSKAMLLVQSGVLLA
jgi:hypothetical protein